MQYHCQMKCTPANSSQSEPSFLLVTQNPVSRANKHPYKITQKKVKKEYPKQSYMFIQQDQHHKILPVKPFLADISG